MNEKNEEDAVKNDSSSSGHDIISRMRLNDNKAGMQGLDREKINKIIMENTVGSRYYKNEQKRDAQIKERIAKMKVRLESVTTQQREEALRKADALIVEIENSRDLTRTIIHIDMDAFFASVEERDQPELKTKPMAVGGIGMLCTSNYIARRYGVRAAMPGFIAKKLCPDLIIVPDNFAKYKQVSKEVQVIFADYDPNFVAMSLDEAHLDITEHLQTRILLSDSARSFEYKLNPPKEMTNEDNNDSNQRLDSQKKRETRCRTFGFSAEEVAEEIRFRIQQKTTLTASAGIAPNTMLAKIGSDLNKPNGQTLIPPSKDYITKFVKKLPIRKVNGIGKVSEQLLSALDIKYCKDILEHRANIVLLFSETSYLFFLRIALGCSSNKLEQYSERKSISTERTFNACSDRKELFLKLEELCSCLSIDMKKANVRGKTVTLKTKSIDFELHTRSKSIAMSVSTSDDIFMVAQELLKQEIAQANNNNLSLRLMGICLSKLEPLSGTNQISIKRFFSKPGKDAADQVSDECTELSLDFNSISHIPVTEEREGLAKVAHENVPETCKENRNGESTRENVLTRTVDCGPSSKRRATNLRELEEMGSENYCPQARSDVSANMVCPVCLQEDFENWQKLNEHLDQCLSNQPARHGEKTCSNASVQPTKGRKVKHHVSSNESNNIPSTSSDEFVDKSFTCPICSVKFRTSQTTLSNFNSHVDSCLNRQAIKAILKEESDSFEKTNLNFNKSSKTSKRRRTESKQCNTIEKYFS